MCVCVHACACSSHQFQETLGSGVVVALLIGQVHSAHAVHTCVDMSHEAAH